MWDQPEQVTSFCSEAQWVLGTLGQREAVANATAVKKKKKKNRRCFMLLCELGNGEFAFLIVS